MTEQSPVRHGIYHAVGQNTEGILPLSLKLLRECTSAKDRAPIGLFLREIFLPVASAV